MLFVAYLTQNCPVDWSHKSKWPPPICSCFWSHSTRYHILGFGFKSHTSIFLVILIFAAFNHCSLVKWLSMQISVLGDNCVHGVLLKPPNYTLLFVYPCASWISDEGRLLQVTAGIKVGSGRKSADGTERELDTIMTPLWVWIIQRESQSNPFAKPTGNGTQTIGAC